MYICIYVHKQLKSDNLTEFNKEDISESNIKMTYCNLKENQKNRAKFLVRLSNIVHLQIRYQFHIQDKHSDWSSL